MSTSTTFNLRAIRNFERANTKANWQDWLSWLTRKNNNLMSLNEILRCLPAKSQHYRGYQFVALDKIVGSEGRSQEFDRTFLPRKTHTKGRWVSIDKARYKGVVLPPVELVKIGRVYFVRDGNHRISVARLHGQAFIDAYVTEIETPVSLDRPDFKTC